MDHIRKRLDESTTEKISSTSATNSEISEESETLPTHRVDIQKGIEDLLRGTILPSKYYCVICIISLYNIWLVIHFIKLPQVCQPVVSVGL